MAGFRISCVLALGLGLAQTASADFNRISIVQNQSGGNMIGNTLFVDLSSASSSMLAGSQDFSQPAAQYGDGNSAEIYASGEFVEVLLQQGTLASPALNNSMDVSATGVDLLGEALQFGDGNIATLTLSGLSSSAHILQDGNLNEGILDVSGTLSSGTLTQTGNSNFTDLSVSGVQTNVTYNLIGDNLSPANNGVVVFSNAGNLIITQTAP